MTSALPDVVLMSDPAVLTMPTDVLDDELVDASLHLDFDGREDDGTGAARLVRRPVLDRLLDAAAALPGDLRLVLNEGYRPPALQRHYFERYAATLRAAHPDHGESAIHRLASRFISPPAVAPHTAGAAVDVLLKTPDGVELDLGCPIDASPEDSRGRCYTDHPDVTGEALRLRRELVRAMSSAGLVNYPTEWWHWSYGDRYWAVATGSPAALYDVVER